VRGSKSGLSVIIGVSLLAGSTVGVSAQDEMPAPMRFTGKIAIGPCTGERETIEEEGRTRNIRASTGRYCEPTVVEPFSDPRLQGNYYVWQDNDEYRAGPTVWAIGVSIVTDEGAWRGIPAIHYGQYGAGEHVLVGEGEYDGLTAIAKVDLVGQTWDWEGWIIGGDLPPLPAEPEAIP